jgi:2-methylthioadenine synthetase
MVERHREELAAELPEVDLFLGASDADRLVPELIERGLLSGDAEVLHPGVRVYAGDLPHVRYLKISEGCDHGCAFCAIPLMRGKHRSFALADVIREAQLLEMQGARELNLVAQDLAHYGRDVRDGNGLPQLLKALISETDIPWLRMLYLYSAGITGELLDVVASEPRVLRYLDMPMQHAADAVLDENAAARAQEDDPRESGALSRCGARGGDPHHVHRRIPRRDEEQFEELAEFLEEMQFERVGVFTYSPQEGTRAATLSDDVPDTIKRERLERLTELQRAITAARYEQRVGKTATAIVDRMDTANEISTARLPWQADDIDGITTLDEALAPGTLAEVAVRGVVDDYDFSASLIRVQSSPVAKKIVRARHLPMHGASVGSYGR